MKLRNVLVIALAVCCVGATGRARKKVKPAKKNAVETVQPVPADSFSYAIGAVQSASLKQYLMMREGVDSAYLEYAAKGLSAQLDEQQLKQQLAYAAGLKIALMNRDQVIPALNKQATGKSDTVYVNAGIFSRALCDGLLDRLTITSDSAERMAERQQKFVASQARETNRAWLEANKKLKGVITTPSGLQYRILSEGKGAVAAADSSEVEVHYEGKLIDGTEFDSSYKRNKPATFRCNQVIKGWTEALKMMPEGSVWELYIPYDLAYGEQGNRSIPPYSTLIFKVELLKVKK